MNLYGYFDESGTHKGSRSFALGGFLGAAAEWGAFQFEWEAALKEFGLPYFHMADFENRLKGYAWPQPIREERINRLLAIIDAHIVGSVGIVLPLDLYDVVFPEDEVPPERQSEWAAPGILAPTASRPGDPPPNREPDMRPGAIRRKSGGPYGLAAIMLFSHVGELIRTLSLSGDPQIAYTMEAGAEGRGQVLKLWSDNYADESQRRNLRLLSLSFKDKRRVLPLQAADLLAYELYKHLPRHRGQDQRPTRYTLRRLGAMPRTWITVDEAELRRWHEVIGLGLHWGAGAWSR